jgi:hypothetical protein
MKNPQQPTKGSVEPEIVADKMAELIIEASLRNHYFNRCDVVPGLTAFLTERGVTNAKRKASRYWLLYVRTNCINKKTA